MQYVNSEKSAYSLEQEQNCLKNQNINQYYQVLSSFKFSWGFSNFITT